MSMDTQITELHKDILLLRKEVAKANKSHVVRNIVIGCITVFIVIQLLKTSNTPEPLDTHTPQVATSGGSDTQPLNGVHYIAGSTTNGTGTKTITQGDSFDMYYYGRDYIRPVGTPIYAPFDGKVTYQSDIGGGTPQITLSSGVEKLHIMHLDTVVTHGDVRQCDLLGYTASNGAYSGGTPHEHVSYYVNNLLSDWELSGHTYEYCAQTISTAYYYGLVVPCSLGTCKLSGYTPMNSNGTFNEGTIQCDDDCSMTASGNATAKLLESDKCYVAAPASIPFDTVVSIDGIGDCIVADRGGFINKIEPNQSDVACANALSKGNLQACDGEITNVTGSTYYWLDIISYGD